MSSTRTVLWKHGAYRVTVRPLSLDQIARLQRVKKRLEADPTLSETTRRKRLAFAGLSFYVPMTKPNGGFTHDELDSLARTICKANGWHYSRGSAS